MHIEKIQSPADLRALDDDQLLELCEEIREFLVDAVSRTGGHLGSNLGAVELTIAVHRVFESPRDAIVWDTGHQAYVHKILTGRAAEFDTLRQRHGLSGYPKPEESEHDFIENSHASASLSWASGLATGFELTGHEHRRVVAVIGDGSMTGGMAFEALNNLGHYGQRAVIILNDNGRSYAPTVSRLATGMSRLRQSPNYLKGRQAVTNILDRLPLGVEVKRGLSGAAAAMREMWEPPAFFETLGVRYLGPIDGHDIGALESALRDASSYEDGPIVVHVLTDKGRGYAPAEADEEKHLHDIGLFDPATGNSPSAGGANFTSEFSRALLDIADRRSDVVAITAAMPGSTGLIPFQDRYPDRFFDVGIAEQHALTSAAGMARAGLRPFVAIYSTFLARGFDQVMYDIGLHQLPVIICIDRAGVTGPDGPSHHGIHDIAMYARVPGMTILAPSSVQELSAMMEQALKIDDGPVAIRWPRGNAQESRIVGNGLSARQVRKGSDAAILAAGPMLQAAEAAADLLTQEGVDAAVWDPRVLKPVDRDMIRSVIDLPLVVTVEDGSRVGGFGSLVTDALQRRQGQIPRLLQLGTPDEYLPHGTAAELHAEFGLDASGIAAEVIKALESS
ncbi:MAG: 1-deoxy-D-xylulose-5-phosphate synthase [Actinomycetota bacterium]|jgi:1-deoxy-D-xylulose-5-phosphate synthase|nr:1-deoxy-D-xylulose-5-phosphate synthase [Actinomycetota bacterium]|tara:strand:+ start:2918 stop:4777 length:1860 start_codon:yes stop_codon:yes gene_type:complete